MSTLNADGENLFAKPPGEWSDAELRAGLAELARTAQWHTDQHQNRQARFYTSLAAVLADERDARAKLYRQMHAALDPFTGPPAVWTE